MKTRALWIALVLSSGLNVGLAVNLWQRTPPPPPPSPGGPGWDLPPPDPGHQARMLRHRLDRLQQSLDLSPSQAESLWSLHRQTGPEILARRRAVGQARRQMHGLLSSAAVVPDSLRAAQRRISALQAELDSLVVALMLQERAVLDPDQAERYRGLFPFGGGDRGGPGRRGGPDRAGGRRHGGP